VNTRTQRACFYSLIGICFVWLLHVTWFRWGHLIVDTFRDQWVFYQISKGKVLYRDIFYFYGFLPPYLMGCIYRLFGPSLAWTVYVGIAVTVVTSVSVYRIGRIFFSRVIATFLVLNFLFLFAFGHYGVGDICNFILPYSFASTLCIMFLLGGIFCLLKYLQRARMSYLRWWVILFACGFFSRIEFSAAAWLVSFFIGAAHSVLYKQPRRIAYFIAAPALAVIGYGIFVAANNASEGFSESAFRFFSFVGSGKSHFSLLTSGFFEFWPNVRTGLIMFAIHVIMLGCFYALSAKLHEAGEKIQGKAMPSLSALLLALCSFWISRKVSNYMMLSQYSLLPFLLFFGIVLYGFQIIKNRKQTSAAPWAGCTLFAVALALIMRIILKAGPFGYGFFLGIPALICYFIFCFSLYPSLFAETFVFKGRVVSYYRLCVAVFLVVAAAPFFLFGPMMYGQRTLKLDFGPKAAFYYYSDELTQRYLETFLYLHDNTKEGDSIVVMPEGVGLNYLLGRDNPLPYDTFLPDQVFYIGEEKIIALLAQHAIDYIVVWTRLSAEYGYTSFGVDYGAKIFQWVKGHYALEKQIGPFPFGTSEFGVAIYKRQ